MNKSHLIAYVEEIAKDTTLKNIISDKEGGKLTIGRSQFRAVAEMCGKADFFEEIRLMLEYKMAKGNGWDVPIKDGKKCGEIFINYIEKIKDGTQGNDKDVLKNIGLFFGYMYWKATVLLSEKNAENRRFDRRPIGGGR